MWLELKVLETAASLARALWAEALGLGLLRLALSSPIDQVRAFAAASPDAAASRKGDGMLRGVMKLRRGVMAVTGA